MPDQDDLPFGLCERLVTAGLKARLLRFDPASARVVKAELEPAEAHATFARHIEELVRVNEQAHVVQRGDRRHLDGMLPFRRIVTRQNGRMCETSAGGRCCSDMTCRPTRGPQFNKGERPPHVPYVRGFDT